ncbi:FAD:protein FMN transferase [Caproiciproducens faecalis]|uniref:FAD:protein FMN transferase n=1 Tax=Caproiciproducens faecalis TaxID=2820301 RepID=A0ABS7DQ34_9FIRM|nr:FAD:protein FMN transferase [Caproiciproducens faecalis]MBW7573216.1 FAD:protein FMN transferase [Caproiciproducens faecalis]
MMLKKARMDKAIDKVFFALGTINYIKIFDFAKEDAIEKAIDRVTEIDNRMSAFKTESDLSKLSRNSGERFQNIHKDTFQLIRKAVEFSDLSNGAFDITIRPLVELWGINKKGSFVPSEIEIQEALRLVDYQDIQLDSESLSAALKNQGQALDLGGIAKGYAADEVKRILVENGIQSAMVNLGGNVITIGSRPDGQPWQVGIQNPIAPTGNYLGVLSITDKTVVTSGSNERFFIKDGIHYHHILDPRTGKPVQNSLLSVTAVCTCSTDADALTTALFILGPEKSMPLLQKFRAEAIFVTDDLTVTVTNGLIRHFKI